MNLAIRIANENENKFRFGCILTHGGRIIAEAQNHMGKSHPLQAKYAKRAGEGNKIWLHAEIRALIQARETPEEIWIARIWRDGSLALAKPCAICTLAIQESGIEKIHYTNEFGKITTVEV
jgi:tRNA(Arg) A34 adenosine deaminase TadA